METSAPSYVSNQFCCDILRSLQRDLPGNGFDQWGAVVEECDVIPLVEGSDVFDTTQEALFPTSYASDLHHSIQTEFETNQLKNWTIFCCSQYTDNVDFSNIDVVSFESLEPAESDGVPGVAVARAGAGESEFSDASRDRIALYLSTG